LMTSRRTEYKGLVVREWTFRQTHIRYTEAWYKLMRHVGKCIKQGGAVTLTTYVEHGRRSNDARRIHERCDATLEWSE